MKVGRKHGTGYFFELNFALQTDRLTAMAELSVERLWERFE